MGLGEGLWRRFLPKYLEMLGSPPRALAVRRFRLGRLRRLFRCAELAVGIRRVRLRHGETSISAQNALVGPECQLRLGVIGGPVLPRRDDAERSARSELLSQWILTAEAKAQLRNLEGGTCHQYRRKWKSERSSHSVKAVAVAGGWTEIAPPMLRCYDHPDDADAVTSEPRKRREIATG